MATEKAGLPLPPLTLLSPQMYQPPGEEGGGLVSALEGMMMQQMVCYHAAEEGTLDSRKKGSVSIHFRSRRSRKFSIAGFEELLETRQSWRPIQT